MAIEVTCSGCLTRFQVSEKFAGKKGPCPKCKALILIPEKQEEVVIHAPAESGPKDSKGQAVLKPLLRQETQLSWLGVGAIVASVVVVLVVAIVLGQKLDHKQDHTVILSVGAILLAPALSFAGYTFLRDSELEPYRGKELWLRLLACSVVYPLIWGLYAGLFGYLDIKPELLYMLGVVPAAVALGGLTSASSLDLEFGMGCLHYAMYLGATIFLRLIMGFSAHWQELAK